MRILVRYMAKLYGDSSESTKMFEDSSLESLNSDFKDFVAKSREAMKEELAFHKQMEKRSKRHPISQAKADTENRELLSELMMFKDGDYSIVWYLPEGF